MRFGLVFANDLIKMERAMRISEAVAPYFDGIKLSIASVLDRGVTLIKEIKKLTDKVIIADFKVADMGFLNKKKNRWEGTNAKIVEKAVNAGADYVICHSITGLSSIQECIDVAHSMGAKVLTLPYMTHEGAELFFGHPADLRHVIKVFENIDVDISENKLRVCETVSDVLLVLGDFLGVDGFIGPANNPEVLRRYRMFTDKEIFGPGIGRQATGGLTPKEQLKRFYEICGERSAAIIGSAIYTADDPTKIAEEFKSYRSDIIGEVD